MSATRTTRKRRGGLRRQLADDLAVRYDLNVELVRALVKDVFRGLEIELATTGRAEVRGFGIWELVPARTKCLRHPTTGEPCLPRSPRDIRFASGRRMALRCGAVRSRHRVAASVPTSSGEGDRSCL